MKVTSEQVGRGHPDKIADQISDMILDKILAIDKDARVAVETLIGKYIVVVSGEVKTNFDYKKNLELEIIAFLSKIDSQYNDFKIILNLGQQSSEISQKVDQKENDIIAAGDQGLMYGYATNETIDYLPIPYSLCNYIMKQYFKYIDLKNENENLKEFPFFSELKEDAKVQASFDYELREFININLSFQHIEQKNDVEYLKLKENVKSFLIKCVIDFCNVNNIKVQKNLSDIFTLNYVGKFTLGGALSDVGLTGRKIVADTYGGLGRHGGGAFSGKDYTKVDRSACYYARYVAKQIVKNNFADICEIQVSYIIGFPNPIAINVETFGTEKVQMEKINLFINNNFNFSVVNIIDELDLKNINYSKLTLFGHFGKDTKWG